MLRRCADMTPWAKVAEQVGYGTKHVDVAGHMCPEE